MWKHLPTPFGEQERTLTQMALTGALVTVMLAKFTGFGSAIIFLLEILAGTVLFIAISGHHRVFFTALYSSSASAGMFVLSCIVGESLSYDRVIALGQSFLLIIGVSMTCAWLVTFVVSRVRRTSRHLDRAP